MYWQMDPQRVHDFLERECRWSHGAIWNRVTGRRVAAILPVHILGHPCDVEPIRSLADRYGLKVIEDATESLGARYRDEQVGHLGHLACLSFNGNKLITMGGGGMLVTDDGPMAARAKYLTTQAKDDPIEFVHGEIGYNYRLSNVLAAIGCAQLEQLDGAIEARRRIAARYDAELAAVPGLVPLREAPWAFSTHWLSTILVDAARYGHDRGHLIHRLSQARIEARPLWQPLHRSPAHKGCHAYGGEAAERIQRDAVSLPSSSGLSSNDQRRVIEAVAGNRVERSV
jgi:perosamine synthetase